MKNHKGIWVLLVLVFGQFIMAQEASHSILEQFKDLPSEKVYASMNTSLLFTGE